MNNSDNGGCLSILIFVIYAIAWIGSGMMAWDWVEPESFGGAILFLIAWGGLVTLRKSWLDYSSPGLRVRWNSINQFIPIQCFILLVPYYGLSFE